MTEPAGPQRRDAGADQVMGSHALTLPDLLRHWATHRPATAALHDPLGRLSFHELVAQVDRCGAALRSAGVSREDRVAIASRSAPSMARLFLGVASHAACVPLDPGLDASAAATLFHRLGLSALIMDGQALEGLGEAAKLSGVPCLVAENGVLLSVPHGLRIESGTALASATAEDSTLYILASSGTTGSPKLVPRTHRSILGAALHRARKAGLSATDVILNPMPLHHAFGLNRLIQSLAGGSTTVCLGRFRFDEYAHWAKASGATIHSASPVVHGELLRAMDAEPGALANWRPRLIVSASSMLVDSLRDALIDRFGVPLITAYGMSEASGIASADLADPAHRPGSVGRPEHLEVRIIDAQGATLRTGEQGEIAVRGAAAFDGYFDDPDADARSFIDGWFRTGDLGRLDEDGFLFLEGRVGELINRGGAKVSAREVELCLLAQPGVRMASVVPVPHPALGQDVLAAVVADAGCALDARGLRLALLERLPAYKVPSRIAVVDALPLGPAGKVRREAVVDLLKNALTSVHRAPRTDSERRACALIADMLHIDAVGLDDDFFSRGGHSLLAVRMLARLEAQTGRHIAVADFMRDPCAAGLAALLDRTPHPCLHRSLEPYRTGTQGSPLFFAPGFDGHSHEVRQLLPFLAPGVPVFGFNTPEELTDSEAPIEAIAADCVERLREIQPQGPYRLAGYSFGGAIAQAMACRLEAAGERVGLLFIIDTVARLDRTADAPSTPQSKLLASGRQHAFKVFGGRTTLIRSWAHPRVELKMPGLGWEHLSRGGVAVFDLPTTHYGAMFGREVSRIGLILDGLLAGHDPLAGGRDDALASRPDFELDYAALPEGFFEARAHAIGGRRADALRALLRLPRGSLPAWSLAWSSELLRRVRVEPPESAAIAQAALVGTMSPTTRDSTMRLDFEMVRGRTEQALALLDRDPLPGVRAETRLLAQATVASIAGSTERAREALRQLVEMIGSRADMYATLVKTLTGKAWDADRELWWQQVMTGGCAAARAELLGSRCRQALRDGHWAAAAQYGSDAVDLLPQISAYNGNLVTALARLGRHEEAARRHQEALERFPGRWGYREVLDRALEARP